MPRWAHPCGNSMAERDLRALTNDSPETLHAYYQAMNAVVEYRNEVGAIQPDQWITAQLKKKQLAATLQLMQFANTILFNS
jgi:hypothetical protein